MPRSGVDTSQCLLITLFVRFSLLRVRSHFYNLFFYQGSRIISMDGSESFSSREGLVFWPCAPQR